MKLFKRKKVENKKITKEKKQVDIKAEVKPTKVKSVKKKEPKKRSMKELYGKHVERVNIFPIPVLCSIRMAGNRLANMGAKAYFNLNPETLCIPNPELHPTLFQLVLTRTPVSIEGCHVHTECSYTVFLVGFL